MRRLAPRAVTALFLLAGCPADEPSGEGSTTDPTSTSSPSTTEVTLTTGMTMTTSTTDTTTTDTTTTTEPTTADSSTSSSTDPDSSGSDSSSSGSSDSSGSESSTGNGAATVVLNELSSNNDGPIGEDPIELYNAGDEEVDISGWIMTDDLTEPYDPEVDTEEHVFPKGTTIAPGAFLVVVGGTKDGHPFGLSGGGDTVRLFDAALVEVDTVTYGDGEGAVSYCRMPDGDGAWQADCTETFGATNM